MFDILKAKSPYKQEAKAVYAQCLKAIRDPSFYTDYLLPDTMEARFDLLLIHFYPIIERNLADSTIDGEAFNQALFDITFQDMDQTLREMGIGDMGLPKRMRKMMTGFNGRMHRYKQAFDAIDQDNDTEALTQAIARNLYAHEEPSPEAEAMASYLINQRTYIASLNYEQMLKKSPLYITR